MLVLITYDVSTMDAVGRRRLQKIAKVCQNVGQRVQNSVFECNLSPDQLKVLENDLRSIMDKETDSLRIYNLGRNYKSRIIHIGAKQSYMPDDVMIL